jgi:hypothetical protein
MAVVFTAQNQAVTATAQDIVAAALLEIQITAAGENPNPEDAGWGLQKLQRLIDQWNARRELIYSIGFQQFTLVANLAPHTIGPGGTFQLSTRPVTIASASFILNATAGGTPVDAPIAIKDKDWWAANPTKTLLSAITTHLYYEPTAPLGTLNFWPICNVANPVRLELWNSLQQAISLGTTLGFAAGYWDAVVTDLAVRLCPSFGKQVSPDLREQWNRAMRIIEANNDAPPRIDTDCGGMPNTRKGARPDFNFLTGLRE